MFLKLVRDFDECSLLFQFSGKEMSSFTLLTITTRWSVGALEGVDVYTLNFGIVRTTTILRLL